MAKDIHNFEELARRAAELGFTTSPDDYRQIENRLKALLATLELVRGIDVADYEPASTFTAAAGKAGHIEAAS